MPIKAQDANISAIKSGKTGYVANAGLEELRVAVAEDFSKKHGVKINEKNVIITSGSTGGLVTAFETFIESGDEVLIPEIYYPLFDRIPKLIGAKVIEYKLTENFDIDTDDLLSKITSKTKLIALNSPSNPTGQVLSGTTLQKLADETKDMPNLFFLSDETYSTCLYENTEHISIARYTDRVVVVDGLSKRASMSGKRLGWLIGPEEIISEAIKVQQYVYVCAPTDSQYAALPILSGECDEELSEFKNFLNKNRSKMFEELEKIKGISFNNPMGAFYCFVDISKFGNSIDVATKLIEKVNVVTVPGLGFGESGDKYLRLSFAGSEESIVEGINRMKGVFEKWEN